MRVTCGRADEERARDHAPYRLRDRALLHAPARFFASGAVAVVSLRMLVLLPRPRVWHRQCHRLDDWLAGPSRCLRPVVPASCTCRLRLACSQGHDGSRVLVSAIVGAPVRAAAHERSGAGAWCGTRACGPCRCRTSDQCPGPGRRAPGSTAALQPLRERARRAHAPVLAVLAAAVLVCAALSASDPPAARVAMAGSPP